MNGNAPPQWLVLRWQTQFYPTEGVHHRPVGGGGEGGEMKKSNSHGPRVGLGGGVFIGGKGGCSPAPVWLLQAGTVTRVFRWTCSALARVSLDCPRRRAVHH